MCNLKIILWDFDGTLADTGKDVWNSVQYAAYQLGGEISKSYIEDNSNLSNPIAEIFKQVNPYPGDERLSKFDQWITKHYRKINMYEETYLYDGIEEILADMKSRNVKNYIVTMKPKEALERLLTIKGWDYLFDGWLSPDSFSGCERTKSELIAHIIENMSFEKEEYIYIGDTWSDVTASHSNEIICIGVTYGDGDVKRLKESKPEYIVDSVYEIKNILKEGV